MSQAQEETFNHTGQTDFQYFVKQVQSDTLKDLKIDSSKDFFRIFEGSRSLLLNPIGFARLKNECNYEFLECVFEEPLTWGDIKNLHEAILSPFFISKDKKVIFTINYDFYLLSKMTNGSKNIF